MIRIRAHLRLLGRHGRTAAVGGWRWTYCPHRSHRRHLRCWRWILHGGLCGYHGMTCWDTCREQAAGGRAGEVVVESGPRRRHVGDLDVAGEWL